MKEAPISKVWIDKLLLYASMMKYETVMPYKEEVKSSYARMSGSRETNGCRTGDYNLCLSSYCSRDWRYDGGWRTYMT